MKAFCYPLSHRWTLVVEPEAAYHSPVLSSARPGVLWICFPPPPSVSSLLQKANVKRTDWTGVEAVKPLTENHNRAPTESRAQPVMSVKTPQKNYSVYWVRLRWS